jgi:AcrR family transcriptional regulator
VNARPDAAGEGLRARKKREVRERLYSEALSLFRRDGYDAVPVSAICDAAGVAKGTFFNHFATKDHVLLEWYERLNASANAAPAPGPLEQRLVALAGGFFDVTLADPDLWRAKHQRAALDADFRKAERTSDAATRALAEQLFAEAADRGEIARRPDAEACAELFVAMLSGTVHDWLLCDGDLDFRETVARRTESLCAALAIHERFPQK